MGPVVLNPVTSSYASQLYPAVDLPVGLFLVQVFANINLSLRCGPAIDTGKYNAPKPPATQVKGGFLLSV